MRIFVFALALFLCAPPLSVAKEVVRISTGEWSPYISESADNKGLLIQIVEEAFKKKNIEVQVEFFPWARAIELSKKGTWDATAALVSLKEREEFYFFSEPIYESRYVFFHLKSKPLNWAKLEDLKGTDIATTRGFGGMGDEFLRLEKNGTLNVQRVTSAEQSFDMLKADRVQAVVHDLEVGYVLLHSMYGDGDQIFTHSSHAVAIPVYRLAVSKKAKNAENIVATFSEGLKLLRKSGRYDEILKNWYQKPVYKDSASLKQLPALKSSIK